jgi:hypothetical protein
MTPGMRLQAALQVPSSSAWLHNGVCVWGSAFVRPRGTCLRVRRRTLKTLIFPRLASLDGYFFQQWTALHVPALCPYNVGVLVAPVLDGALVRIPLGDRLRLGLCVLEPRCTCVL